MTAAGLLFAAIIVMRTLPPRVVVMATGTEGGAYHEIGKRYREILAAQGVELQLRQTGGSVENVALLSRPAFRRQRGPGSGRRRRRQRYIAAWNCSGQLFYEPLWLFHAKRVARDRT